MNIKWTGPYPPMPSPVGMEDMAKSGRNGPSAEKEKIRVRVRLAGWLGRWGADLLLGLGAVLISVGVGWVYPPAGLVAAGVLLIAGGVLWARGGGGP